MVSQIILLTSVLLSCRVLPLWTRSCRPALESPWFSLSLSVSPCLCECWLTGCQVHIIWAGGGKPVTLSYLPAVVSKPPHPQLHFYSSCASSSSKDGCFSVEDPSSHIFPPHHTLLPEITHFEERGVGGCASLASWVVIVLRVKQNYTVSLWLSLSLSLSLSFHMSFHMYLILWVLQMFFRFLIFK